jgi:hypothetical protein
VHQDRPGAHLRLVADTEGVLREEHAPSAPRPASEVLQPASIRVDPPVSPGNEEERVGGDKAA